MTLPSDSYSQLASDLKICKILNGMWQVSGSHGFIDFNSAIEDMLSYHNFGFTTWDLADIYGPAEDFVGEFIRRLSLESDISKIQALTKFVPSPGPMSKQLVEQSIDVSRRRMGVDALDLIQFHWWDYSFNAYHDALIHLQSLTDSGKIKHIGLTNFDTEHLEIIHDWKVNFISNQVQYSIIDQRPSIKMEKFCLQNNVGLLAYGTLLGGLLSDKYLDADEPSPDQLETASLQKYKHMIDAWGGWDLFQNLLQVCNDVAQKHNVSIANIATRYVLEKPAVSGVIIGTRLGVTNHQLDNSKTFDFTLDSDDYDVISSVTEQSSDLFSLIGDCGSEYRR